ncbi:MAG: hypothetical protein IPG89_17665 [Bacteroidetes bacterium]|nr:hypothetical protein [Bacteroidota bacterium]
MEDLNYQMIGIDGAHPIWIGGPCDGVSVMAIFLIFVSLEIFCSKTQTRI